MREIGGKLGNMEMGYNQFTWFPATIRCVSLRPCSSCFVLCQVLLSLVFWWHLSNMNILNLQIHVYQYMYETHFLIYSIYTYTYTFVLTHWIGLYTTILVHCIAIILHIQQFWPVWPVSQHGFVIGQTWGATADLASWAQHVHIWFISSICELFFYYKLILNPI